jgi:UDP-N-acetylmuramate: L-alanyl-gamma-D-glutamyl-meso-diaminopimelate ligase
MEVSIAELNKLTQDQQRVVVVGDQRQALISMVTYILRENNKPYDYFSNGNLQSQKGAPTIIIEAGGGASQYSHHIGVVTKASSQLPSELETFANATPKSGILFYPDGDATLKAIFGKERADVQLIAYTKLASEFKNGVQSLVSSTNERFPIKITGDQNLLLLGCAKELLKKIGISSGQFYRFISTFS